MKSDCAWCGNDREVYAYQEADFEKDVTQKPYIYEGGKGALRDGDQIGFPICKECAEANEGAEEKKKSLLGS